MIQYFTNKVAAAVVAAIQPLLESQMSQLSTLIGTVSADVNAAAARVVAAQAAAAANQYTSDDLANLQAIDAAANGILPVAPASPTPTPSPAPAPASGS